MDTEFSTVLEDSVKRKLNKSLLKLNLKAGTPCPGCGSDHTSDKMEHRGNGMFEFVFECKACGFVATS